MGTADMEDEGGEQSAPREDLAGKAVVEADIPAGVVAVETGVPLSKNKQKKLLRSQRYEEVKEAKKLYEREKRKANRLKAKQRGEDLGKQRREANARPKVVVPAKVVVDLSFDELMTEKEVISMVQQLSQVYSSNRLSSRPFSSVVFSGPCTIPLRETVLGKRMEKQMKGQWNSWKSIVIRETGGLEGFDTTQGDADMICPKDGLVYLTADSSNTIERIEEGKAYIIGGIVDRNRHKRLCADKAERLGIQTAKLPIDATRLTTSAVLTVNQVMDILLAYNETLDWEETMDRCLPKRKIKDREKDTLMGSESGLGGTMGQHDDDNIISNTNNIEDEEEALYNSTLGKRASTEE